MPKSTYLANKLLDLPVGAVAFTAPATLYFGLYNSAPTAGGGGQEVAGGSYARATLSNNTTNFPAATSGAKSNATAITWPTATAAWNSVVAVGVFDAATGGNLLYFATISSKTVDSNDTVSIPVGNFTLTET
jgi:hypothetical protein